jgi:hypothetical protein
MSSTKNKPGRPSLCCSETDERQNQVYHLIGRERCKYAARLSRRVLPFWGSVGSSMPALQSIHVFLIGFDRLCRLRCFLSGDAQGAEYSSK